MVTNCRNCGYPYKNGLRCSLCGSIGSWYLAELLVVSGVLSLLFLVLCCIFSVMIVSSNLPSPINRYSTPLVTATSDALIQLFGPKDGQFVYHRDGNLHASIANVTVDNFIVEATFHNPYSVDMGEWVVGYIFRFKDEDTGFGLGISSDKIWFLGSGTEDGFDDVTQGEVTGFNISENGSNTIKLIGNNNVGELYVNNGLVSTIDLSEYTDFGDVAIVAKILPEQDIDNVTLRYENFTIWGIVSEPTATAQAQATTTRQAQLKATQQAFATVTTIATQANLLFGPESEQLRFEDNLALQTKSSQTSLKNFIAESTFINPDIADEESWMYGFILEHNDEYETYIVLAITSQKQWLLGSKFADEALVTIDNGRVHNLNVTPDSSNKIISTMNLLRP